MTFDGIVRNGAIVLEQGAVLPEGTRVKVVADVTEDETKPTHLSLLKLGTNKGQTKVETNKGRIHLIWVI